MGSPNRDLNILYDQVDDWFSNIPLGEPISNINLEDDLAKLAAISEATLDWFELLTNPPLTNEGLEEDQIISDDQQLSCNIRKTGPMTRSQACKRVYPSKKIVSSNHKTRTTRPAQTLDSLARDLELLLESDNELLNSKDIDESQNSETYFYSIHLTDELALLDTTIGHSCTILNSSQFPTNSSKSSRRENEISVVTRGDGMVSYEDQNEQRKDLKTCIPMPLDHDYLARPRRISRQLAPNKKLAHARKDNILNTDALRRFARFSDGFRVLSMIDC